MAKFNKKNFKLDTMRLGGSVVGGVAGSLVDHFIETKSESESKDMIKVGVKAGAGLLAPMFMRGDFVRSACDGLIAVSAYELSNQKIIPMLTKEEGEKVNGLGNVPGQSAISAVRRSNWTYERERKSPLKTAGTQLNTVN